MGFGDKLKGLRDQAQQAVAENKDKIQGAVQVVGDAANAKTHGKYATKIAKVGDRVEAGVDKFAAAPAEGAQAAEGTRPAEGTQQAPGAAPDPAFNIEGDTPQEESADAPIVNEPPNPVSPSAADEGRAGFPEFE